MLNAIIIIAIVIGLIFFLGAVVGVVRFPDFYTRMHAAGKGDTLSTLLILAGLALYVSHQGLGVTHLLVMAKILGICAFIMFTSPTCTHSLMQAGFEDGIEPFKKDEKEKKEP